MKDQATHIRLIRDENGKPVEAEYEPNWDSMLLDDLIDFKDWSLNSRIPVTGDWPDREVFAMSEVEEEPQFYDEELEYWLRCHIESFPRMELDGIKTRVALKLRLKAKQEPKQDSNER